MNLVQKIDNRLSPDDCIPVWKAMIRAASERSDIVRMSNGQQDAHEGLMIILDQLDNLPEIKRLFEYRQRIMIYCNECKEYTVDHYEQNTVFEVQPDLRNEQLYEFKDMDSQYNRTMDLNDFLIKQNSYVDKDFRCPKCQLTGYKFKTVVLTMIPEILVVLIKKYNNKQLTNFPLELTFNAKNNNILKYKLVAQSEHSGNMSGGHYWAICLRRDNQWYQLNDQGVSLGQPGPTANTYILFYHYALN